MADQTMEVIEPRVQQGSPAMLAVNPLDMPSEIFQAGLQRRQENRNSLLQWVRSALVQGVDFGSIHVMGKDKCRAGAQCTNQHHFSKPSLFKPGAEKICGMLGVTIHYPTLPDYEQAVLNGVVLDMIIIRCEIKDVSNRVIADGVGARSLKQDYGDLNKALKMAEKSAHIDATLRMVGLSEIFTQDIEDMPAFTTNAAGDHGQKPEANTQNTVVDPLPVSKTSASTAIISETERRRLEATINKHGLDRERVKAWLVSATKSRDSGAVSHFNELPRHLFHPLLTRLDRWASEKQRQNSQQGVSS